MEQTYKSYTCKWHPRISGKGTHSKEECWTWHTEELRQQGTDQHWAMVGRKRGAVRLLETAEALVELSRDD